MVFVVTVVFVVSVVPAVPAVTGEPPLGPFCFRFSTLFDACLPVLAWKSARNAVQVLICATREAQKPRSSSLKPRKSGANEDLNTVTRVFAPIIDTFGG